MFKKIGLMVASGVLVISPFVSTAFAQMASSMPVLYSQSGVAVNVNPGYLASGNYYLGAGQSSGGHLINYYGNGTYYDPTIMQYGGSIYNSNGTAGVALGYSYVVSGSNMAMMPTLYNSNGQTVNVSAGTLAAGYYYIGSGPSTGGRQIEYYGNGTFYNSSILQYGGSVTNPSGAAGVSLGYSA